MDKIFQQCNNIFTRQIQKQPDDGSDQYAAKCKQHLGSEHAFKHIAEFLQRSFYRPSIAARALILHASSDKYNYFQVMSGQLIKWFDIVCYMFMPSGLCLCMHNIVLLLSNKGYQAV